METWECIGLYGYCIIDYYSYCYNYTVKAYKIEKSSFMSNLKLAFCSLSRELFTILINIGTAYNCFGVTSTHNLYFAFLHFPLLGFSTTQKSNQMLFWWEKPITLVRTVTWVFFFFFFETENSFNELNWHLGSHAQIVTL